MNRLILAAAAATLVAATAAPVTAQQEARVTMLFETDSDAITPQARAQIAAFARNHRGAPDDSVRVEGHATLAESYENSSGYAVGLAQRRAGNVRSVLVEEGLRPEAIVIATFGATRPLGNTPAASPRNRRVELFMSNGAGW
ncbi:OmpA family protein [Brevundimonas sp. NPDC092305]|uniref:OmpA family protein n=1 Tax=Brevundimonas sp. NPDC092305 TaxID=3363957 RepID=UPI0038078F92